MTLCCGGLLAVPLVLILIVLLRAHPYRPPLPLPSRLGESETQ